MNDGEANVGMGVPALVGHTTVLADTDNSSFHLKDFTLGAQQTLDPATASWTSQADGVVFEAPHFFLLQEHGMSSANFIFKDEIRHSSGKYAPWSTDQKYNYDKQLGHRCPCPPFTLKGNFNLYVHGTLPSSPGRPCGGEGKQTENSKYLQKYGRTER